MTTLTEKIKKSYKYLPKAAFNYSVNISEKSSFIYIETAKVACSTIKRTLQDLETEVLGLPPMPVVRNVHKKPESPLLSPDDIGLDNFCEMLKDAHILKFAFVRNPYTRALSAYLDKIKKESAEREKIAKRLNVSSDTDISFETFLTCVSETPIHEMDHHWRPQSYQLMSDLIEYDFIGRFENLSVDLEKVLKKIYSDSEVGDRTVKRYSPHSTQADARLPHFYTEVAVSLVKKVYQKDFDNFDYSLELPVDGVEQIDERYLEYFAKGEKLLKTGDIPEAIQAIQTSIELNPSFCWSHHCLGNALFWNQEEEAAVLAYQRATDLNPDLTASHRQLSRIFAKFGDLEKAQDERAIADQLDRARSD
ncbi:MAG: sulfotransferase family 2 domain-containing protein [Phormidesmis sp.]